MLVNFYKFNIPISAKIFVLFVFSNSSKKGSSAIDE